MSNNNPSLAEDLLWGGEAIAAEINRPVKKTFYMLEIGEIPARKVGRLWVGSRTRLRQFFNETKHPAADNVSDVLDI